MTDHDRVSAASQLERWSGALLLAFVALQLVYLVIDIAVVSPPSPDAPVGELRTMVVQHADPLRWHTLLALTSFTWLFLPGAIGLRRRLRGSGGGELISTGALLIMVTVMTTVLADGLLGLVPVADLSDSMLHMLAMTNVFSALLMGNFATALFAAGVSAAMLDAGEAPRWLAWSGFAVAGLGLIGALWLVGGDVGGTLFGVATLSRALWLAWIVAVGVWLHRTSISASAPLTPASAPA
jgi:hypothetical protein